MRPFDWRARIAEAQETLARPKAREWISRPDRSKGAVLFCFALPLELCRSFNVAGRAGAASATWAIGKLKSDTFSLMYGQLVARHGRPPTAPLTGRPVVHCVRFSSTPTDRESGWCKNPVDRLRVGSNGLGIIRDDSEEAIDLRAWWEPAKPSSGFVYLEVRA